MEYLRSVKREAKEERKQKERVPSDGKLPKTAAEGGRAKKKKKSPTWWVHQ